MLTTVSSNAILAKSRAMYGRRLTERNYTELLNCHSVNEVANYLEKPDGLCGYLRGDDHYRYPPWPAGDDARKSALFDQYASLCRYEMSIGQDFYQYFIVRSDIDQIMSCARFLSTGHPGDYLFAMPAFFNQHTKLDLYALAAVNSFESLLAALEGTPYYDMMHLFARKAPSEINFLDMEAVFQRYLYDRLEELIEKGFKGKDRKEVMSAVGMQLDMEAIVNLYRLKRMGGRSPEEIRRSVVIGPISRLRRRQFELLVEAPSAAEMVKQLDATPYGRKFQKDFSFIEDSAQKLQYGRCLKDLRFSTNPSVVMLSFMFLAENEVNNITHIIEGIRYQVPAQEISRMLIGVGD